MPSTLRVWPGRLVRRLVAGLPTWIRVVGGLVVATGGLALTGRPLTSLEALALCVGIGGLVVGGHEVVRAPGVQRRLLGVVWVGLGVASLVWRAEAVAWIGLAVSAALLVTGAVRLLGVRRGAPDARASAALLGLAEIGLGAVALAWPDVALVVVAAVFGIRLVVLGVTVVVEALRRRTRRPATDAVAWRRAGRLLWAVTAFVLVLGLVVSTPLLRDRARVDGFYDRPAGQAASGPPGTLLRSEPFTRLVPKGAKAWRILYRTQDANGGSALASAIVVVPTSPGPHPVVAWAHGTTGLARQCAPSLLDDPWSAGGFPEVLDDVVDRGWAVVATDYPGLGTSGTQPYLIGPGEAHSVLDSVRAARRLGTPEARLDDRTVVWGHSQGGGAALWTDQLQADYAPDVPLDGVAAMAPAADLPHLIDNLTTSPAGAVFAAFVATAFSQTYSDIELADVVRPAAIPLVERLATRCPSDPDSFASILTAIAIQGERALSVEPTDAAWGRRLAENVPTDLGGAPVLVAQGEDDPLVVPDVQRAYVKRLRAAGHDVDYRTYPGLDHGTLVQRGSNLLPQLLTWTERQLARRQ